MVRMSWTRHTRRSEVMRSNKEAPATGSWPNSNPRLCNIAASISHFNRTSIRQRWKWIENWILPSCLETKHTWQANQPLAKALNSLWSVISALSSREPCDPGPVLTLAPSTTTCLALSISAMMTQRGKISAASRTYSQTMNSLFSPTKTTKFSK